MQKITRHFKYIILTAVFVFPVFIFAAWVDAPASPPGYGLSGCTPKPCAEEDFKPIMQNEIRQVKRGGLIVGVLSGLIRTNTTSDLADITSGPLEAFEVNGKIRASGFFDAQNPLYFIDPASDTSSGNLFGGLMVGGKLTALNLTVSGGAGIGATTDPREKLEVTGGTRFGQAPTTFPTLSAAMSSLTGTTATTSSTTSYPSVGTLLIDSEAMTYTNTTATTFTGLIRGALGTAAATHAIGATVKNYLFTALATATTPRMVITGDGNVGIGTTGPGYKLDVAGDINLPATGFLRIAGLSGSTGQVLSRISTGLAWQTPVVGANYWTLNATNDISNNNSSGRVGIGTTPNAKFDVGNGSDGVVIYQQVDNTQTIQAYIDGTWATRTTYASGCCNSLLLQPDVGNVGIGTTAPGAKLHILGSVQNTLALDSPSYPELTLRVGGVIKSYDAISTAAGGYFGTSAVGDRIIRAEAGNILFGYGSTELVRITTGGRVGIGTTPNAKFDVGNGSDGVVIYQQTDNTQTIQAYIDGTWATRTTYASGCCNSLLLQPDVGNVGIGTTAPGAKLDVLGNITVGFANATYITLRDDESPNGIKYIHANSNVVGFLSGAGSWLSYWDNAGNQVNYGGASFAGNVTIGGDLVADGNTWGAESMQGAVTSWGYECPAGYYVVGVWGDRSDSGGELNRDDWTVDGIKCKRL